MGRKGRAQSDHVRHVSPQTTVRCFASLPASFSDAALPIDAVQNPPRIREALG
jgi:hypothetical protein